MSLFWNRKKNIQLEEHKDEVSSIKVTNLHKKRDQTVTRANKDIKKLNDLLLVDGITLKIHIASGGHHGK